MILDDIAAKKRERLKTEMAQVTLEGWKQKIKAPGLHKPLDFGRVLKREDGLAIIAEVKKASPSAGVICENFDPARIARDYLISGVQAISVLTEKDYFLGDDCYLAKVRQNVPIPVLRKDFIIDLWQVYQSRCMGADAILLIVALLDDELLKKMLIVAGILGLQCLVEVHDERELDRALNSGARIIGINNRDLRTFQVDLATTAKLINNIPHDRIVVSESGIKTAEDMKYVRQAGADAVLIGESLMRAGCVADRIRELRAV
ncbi:MAG TPA: indole-3-glycerol phosphate synthase TrpC [Clostridia bacterium]|nr:indole-3-glycerol phosphate synthase TrpC [Clostridia bacterium]